MRMVIIQTLALSLFTNSTQAATNHLLYLGGGGEASNKTSTVFDNSLEQISSYLKNSSPQQWTSTVRFNGGHTDTEKILNESFPKSSNIGHISAKEFNDQIKNHIEKIKNGTIKEGEKLLVMINSHGTIPSGKSHEVAVSSRSSEGQDYENLSSSEKASLDILAELSSVAKAKNINLGIIDFTCHSGASQVFANSNTCVISASGPDTYSYPSFSKFFIGNMASGKSLEDIYLETRTQSSEPSFPTISTGPGKEISSLFYDSFNQFLAYNSSKAGKLFNNLLNKATQCQSASSDVETLTKEIQKLQSEIDLSELKKKLAAYAALQDNIMKEMRELQLPQYNKIEIFQAEEPYAKNKIVKTDSFSLSTKQILNYPIEQNLTMFSNELKTAKGAQKIAEAKAYIKMIEKIRSRQKEIKEKYPDFVNYDQQNMRMQQKIGETWSYAQAVAEEERKVYDRMYKNHLNKNNGKNPCKDFIL